VTCRSVQRGRPSWAPVVRSLGLGAALVVLLALVPRTALGVGEQNARLRGTVLEAGTRVAMPGAKVQIQSDALIGGPRIAHTDEEGNFDFLSIPHGTYVITVTYEGLRPVKRKVRLQLGETETVQISFAAELAEAETTTIIEERRRIDTDKVGTGRVLTAEQQSKIPTARSYQTIVQQLPGVVNGGSNPVMAGGSLRHNRYLVDGLDITDPVTNTFSANFNFDAIAQVDTLLLAVDAQYNSLGGVVNLVTKRGSDKFALDASFYFNHQALSAGGRAGTQIYEGRLLDQSDPRPPNASYQGNLNISGPLVKQKLWFYLSTEFRYTLSAVVPGPPLNLQHVTREFIGIYPRLKLTWAPASRHRIELSVNSDPAFISNLVQANANADESEYNQRQGGAFGILNWDWFVTDRVVFGLQTGVTFQNLYITPSNGDYVSSQHFDRASSITWNNPGNSRFQDDQRWRFQFDPTLTWNKKGWVGSHTFKAGVQAQYLRNYRIASTPGNSTYTDDTNQTGDSGLLVRDPTSTERPLPCVPGQPNPRSGSLATPCFQTTQYDPLLAQVRTAWGIGAFLQDTWKPTGWLTLVPGLRVDYGNVQNSRGEIVQNLLGFGPRLGVNVALTRDNKTLLRLAYGRANEVVSLFTAFSADATPKAQTWQWNRATSRYDRFSTSSGGADGYDLRGRCPDGTVTVECGNAKLSLSPPHSDYVTLGLERELFPNVVGGLTYTYRLISDQWEDIELNASRTLDGVSYAAFGDKRAGNVYAYRPVQEAFRRYNGLDVVIAGNPSPNWSVTVAYTLSWLEGTVDDQITTFRDDIPRDFRLYGYLADDHRHQVKGLASYTWKGLTAGVNLTYLSGAPATRLYQSNIPASYYTARYGWRGVDPNSDPNDIRKWSELRTPDILDIALRAQYDFFGQIKQHLSLIADLFNAFDLTGPVGGNTTLYQAGFESRNIAATYGTVLNRQTPIRLQLAVRFQY